MQRFASFMRGMVCRRFIPLFAKKPSHPSVPLDFISATARSRGQGRSKTGACALPLTEASPVAPCRNSGGGTKALIAFLLFTGLCATSMAASDASAKSTQHKHTVQHDGYAEYIAEASQRFRIPSAWIRAVMRVESAGNSRTVSSKGAMGLMQIMPGTWKELSARYQLGKDPFDPRNNIIAGAAYLRELHDRYGSPGFLAAYNAGPKRYEDYLSMKRALPSETRAYVVSLLPFFGGGKMPDPVSVAATSQHRWRRSSLFVLREARLLTDVRVQSEDNVGIATTTTSVRDVSAIVPFSDGLFVPRSKSQQ